jgi:hypothetical protein
MYFCILAFQQKTCFYFSCFKMDIPQLCISIESFKISWKFNLLLTEEMAEIFCDIWNGLHWNTLDVGSIFRSIKLLHEIVNVLSSVKQVFRFEFKTILKHSVVSKSGQNCIHKLSLKVCNLFTWVTKTYNVVF